MLDQNQKGSAVIIIILALTAATFVIWVSIATERVGVRPAAYSVPNASLMQQYRYTIEYQFDGQKSPHIVYTDHFCFAVIDPSRLPDWYSPRAVLRIDRGVEEVVVRWFPQRRITRPVTDLKYYFWIRSDYRNWDKAGSVNILRITDARRQKVLLDTFVRKTFTLEDLFAPKITGHFFRLHENILSSNQCGV